MAPRGTNAPLPNARAGLTCLPYLLIAGLCLDAAACASASVDGTKRDAAVGDAEPKTDASPGDQGARKDGPAPDVSYGICDPFTNSGCGGGQKCTALQQSDGKLALGCDSKGPNAAGSTCTRETTGGAVSADDCDSGLACFSIQTGASATCHRICPTGGTANACPSGEACTLVVSGLTGLAFCQATTSCLPLEQTGCPSGQACYVDQTGVICAPAGSSQPGEACTHANDCAKGSTCLMVGSSGTCSSFCSTASGGTPSCSGSATGGTICEPIGGEPNLGNCRVQP